MFLIKTFNEFSTNRLDYTIVERIRNHIKNKVTVYTRLFIKKSMLDFYATYEIGVLKSLQIEFNGMVLDYDDIVIHNETFLNAKNQNDYDLLAILIYTNHIKNL